ncbi:MAG: ribosomal protein S18-alanine N-acetyltransferase [Defluviitaleaceae bacterium]|nr:ribosomal protein S18-alanine N-acetyltransferase [Defluviitaleaceae bacterium]
MQIIDLEKRHIKDVYVIDTYYFSSFKEKLSLASALLFRRIFTSFRVAVIDGRVVGSCSIINLRDGCHINNISVDFRYRNKGIGQKLLLDIMGIAKANGNQILLLEVRQSNQTAISLYKKHGFIEYGLKKNYYPLKPRGKEDAVLMQKIL